MLVVVNRFKSEKKIWEPGQEYSGSMGEQLLAQGLLKEEGGKSAPAPKEDVALEQDHDDDFEPKKKKGKK